ncbi:MAG: zinc-ribbon domain-containing protein [Lachnospiraceae bacterium]|nr:zinc-ribbon domain-containing protein [Lachnospiraceae bacterium]
MVNFCANCGSKLEKGDKVCGNCGTAVEGMHLPKMESPASAAGAAKQKGNGNAKIAILIGAGVAFFVVLAIGISIAANFTGYKGTVRNMVKALQEYDMETLYSLTSLTSDEIYEYNYGNDFEVRYQEMVSDTLDKYEDNVGNIKKITYEISDVTELSDRRVEEIKDSLILYYNLDVSNIKKIMQVSLTLTVKGSEKSASYRVSSLYFIKESGKWKLYYGSLSY